MSLNLECHHKMICYGVKCTELGVRKSQFSPNFASNQQCSPEQVTHSSLDFRFLVSEGLLLSDRHEFLLAQIFYDPKWEELMEVMS